MAPCTSNSVAAPLVMYQPRGVFSIAKTSKQQTAYVALLDMRVRTVEKQEDAYWRTRFCREDYYVPGRGYDQYQPAYAMGCSNALQQSDADFQDLEREMEAQWATDSGSSLLPWREVRFAIQAAWERTASHRLKIELPALNSPAVVDVLGDIQPIYRSCVALADDLQRMGSVPMSSFAHQVLQRHSQMLRGFALTLQKKMALDVRRQTPDVFTHWSHCWRSQWAQFKNRMAEWEPAQVFELCEVRERKLFTAYQRTLHKKLPAEISELLQQQSHQLKINVDRLGWVRANWSL
ncbi:MAG: hypothetical protein ITG01_09725 [Comamonas sp.]|nr:hypothetical protein [Comamonas sp.]